MLTVFIRSLILYIVVVCVMRLMGKRQLGQLQPFELVIALMLADLASIPMGDTAIPLIYGIAPIIALWAIHQLISFWLLKSARARAVICGKPAVLVRHGKVIEHELIRQACSLSDLFEQLRINGISDINEVDSAILEPTGAVSVIKRTESSPLTPKDAQIPVAPRSLPYPLIQDGRLMTHNLEQVHLSPAWLSRYLKDRGADSVRDVLFFLWDPVSSTGWLQLKNNEKEARS